jgi:putative Mg2+ transporter-C (MgtC) family protein
MKCPIKFGMVLILDSGADYSGLPRGKSIEPGQERKAKIAVKCRSNLRGLGAMPTTMTWREVVLRLTFAAVAGVVVGFNRGQHGRAAGPRTMVLVTGAAALAMILSDYLALRGPPVSAKGFAVNMDVLRLPLGILSGMGFLGAGAILKRGNLVQGVTTAASMWYMSVVGLCFGGGYLMIGLIGLAMAVLALFLMPWVELFAHADHLSLVTVVTRADALSEQELYNRLSALKLQPRNLTIDYQVSERLKTLCCEVSYQRRRAMLVPRQVVSELSEHPGVIEVKWDWGGAPGDGF